MTQPSSEPERYTIDEMMDRLKSRDSSDKEPELVTRPDGSQAMRVKKRKRRSNQAVNEETKRNHRVQIIQIAGFVVVLILLGLALGVGVLYANSSAYRKSLISKMEASSGAKLDIEQFRMNPMTANAGGATLAWPPGNALSSLKMRAISARIAPSSFTGKTFGGEEIVANSGKLELKAPDSSLPAVHPASADNASKIRFSRYSIRALDASFGESGSLSKTEVSLYPGASSGRSEIRMRGGLLQFKDWPPMNLDRSYIKAEGGGFDIKALRLQMPETTARRLTGGTIDFSGRIEPLSDLSPHNLAAQIEGFALPYLLGGDLGRLFLGRVDSRETPDSNYLSFDFNSPQDSLLELTVTNAVDSRVDLAGFNFLQKLSLAFQDGWYEFPNFDDEVSMVIRRQGAKVSLADINLVKRGRMAVRGSVANGEGGAIRGKLRIGIPETTLAAAADSKLSAMFGPVREGYRWVDLEISGTAAAPEDDFRSLYMSTGGAAEVVPESKAGEGAKDSFDDLIKGE